MVFFYRPGRLFVFSGETPPFRLGSEGEGAIAKLVRLVPIGRIAQFIDRGFVFRFRGSIAPSLGKRSKQGDPARFSREPSSLSPVILVQNPTVAGGIYDGPMACSGRRRDADGVGGGRVSGLAGAEPV